MGDLTEHFSRREFECHCGNDCGFIAADIKLLNILEKIRNHYNKPVHVNCVNRCPEHNESVGSKPTSQHIRGLAADIYIIEVPARELAEYIDSIMPGSGGIGIYTKWKNPGVHVDVRKNGPKRWSDE